MKDGSVHSGDGNKVAPFKNYETMKVNDKIKIT